MFALLKKGAKALLPKTSIYQLRLVRDRWSVLRRLEVLEQNQTNGILYRYARSNPELAADECRARSKMRSHEYKVFSQNGEDGILLYIFSHIGITNRQFVEFGIGDGRECCSANLSINFGWEGLLMEGNPSSVSAARLFYWGKRGISPDKVKIAHVFVTAEEINDSIAENGLSGEIDLLSVDIDGNDYWIWKAIEVVTPRVVVCEYNPSFTIARSITVKYDPKFDRMKKHPKGWYHGASLAALNKVATLKGYSLVGCNSHGCNAFFVRDDCCRDSLATISVEDAFYPHLMRNRDCELDFEVIKEMPFVEV